MPRWDLRGKVALITGASAGIGRSLAIELAKRGMHLGLAARSLPELEAAAEACRAFGVRALPVSTDVGNEAECRRFVETAAREFGRIDLLVNNAGIGMWARFEDVTDLSIFERLMRINYFGTVWTTHAALPHLIDSRGLIVGISSLTGKTGVPTRSGYAASKHAMQGFLDSIRVELEGRVDVSVISPGFVSTDIRARGLGADGKPRGESPRNEDKDNMSVDDCVALIVKAIEQREREVVMTAKARAGLWLRLIAPKLVDRMAAKAVRER